MTLQHKGCDICIYDCHKPIILLVCGHTYRGHKDCMHYLKNELLKESKKIKYRR